MTTATPVPVTSEVRTSRPPAPEPRIRAPRVLAYAFLITFSIGMITPILWAFYMSLRPVSETIRKGNLSWPDTLTFDNYVQAWQRADLGSYFLNTLTIVIPAIIVVLLLSTFVAYGLARFSFRFNLALLMLFTAGNLLPQQVVITPLYRLYLHLPAPWTDSGVWANSQFGVVMIHIAFQMGFCTFVMSSYMKTLPVELTEAALVDGASVWRQFWQVILPLCRAPLAALATLEFTWIYNDFFWALVLMIGRGEDQPITTALASLNGTFFTDDNLVAAGSLITAVPTIVVFIVLQKHFVGGLTLGANKG
ncbi:carbohydrate ABC transporter permease [Nocardioides mesophilus]|uniref:Carbohydrate ABC transporter permease n=1 Tax=Nocardioides mesophilus TaxID=433659 RepID=A0A7G9RDF1_9ACTN|nr:carbohydrate ABC transporter permease [Nocardioides mesophilus]QNN53626.1 carbohydrate ABC transporter permease [Nocardioides mesophilus]